MMRVEPFLRKLGDESKLLHKNHSHHISICYQKIPMAIQRGNPVAVLDLMGKVEGLGQRLGHVNGRLRA